MEKGLWKKRLRRIRRRGSGKRPFWPKCCASATAQQLIISLVYATRGRDVVRLEKLIIQGLVWITRQQQVKWAGVFCMLCAPVFVSIIVIVIVIEVILGLSYRNLSGFAIQQKCTVRFFQIENRTVRIGAVLENRKSYGAVRCGFQVS